MDHEHDTMVSLWGNLADAIIELRKHGTSFNDIRAEVENVIKDMTRWEEKRYGTG